MLHKRAIREIVPWDASRSSSPAARARVAEERVKTLVRDAAAPNAVTAEDLRDVLARMAPALEQIAADEDDAVAPETHPEIAAAIAAIGEEKKRAPRGERDALMIFYRHSYSVELFVRANRERCPSCLLLLKKIYIHDL